VVVGGLVKRLLLVNAPTARSGQAVCRGRLIRLPSDAIGVRRLRVVARAARGALRAPRRLAGTETRSAAARNGLYALIPEDQRPRHARPTAPLVRASVGAQRPDAVLKGSYVRGSS